MPPETLFLQDSANNGDKVTINQIGGNATLTNSNNPNDVRGVAGGLRLGELLVFRYVLPTADRFRMDSALNVKWFGDEVHRLACGYEELTVAAGCAAAFPNADLTVTNLVLRGTLSARTLSVRNLDLLGDTSLSIPLRLASGGSLKLAGNATDGFNQLMVPSVDFGEGGTLDLTGVDLSGMSGRAFRISPATTVTGQPKSWKSGSARSSFAHLESRNDGVYIVFGSGTVFSVR